MGTSSAGASSRDELLAAASAAARQAHATRSGVHVGAALRSAAGHIYAGCNVENVAYPLGNCAEPAAISAGVLAEGPDFRIAEVAVWAETGQGDPLPASPCGGCRQRLVELAVDPDVLVHFNWSGGGLRSASLRELLPYPFSLSQGSTE